MIKKIKEKLNWAWDKICGAGRWIKERAGQIVASLLIAMAFAAPILLAPQTGHVTAPENNAFKIGVLNYDVVLAQDITSDKPLQYQLDGKYFSLKPAMIKIDEAEIKALQPTSAMIKEKSYYYEGIFGEGIDLDMNFGDRVWSKVIKIDKADRIGIMPINKENIELWFKVETNFVIDGWNRKDDFEIIDTVRLGDYSYIEPAMAWDSYSEEVCQEIQVWDSVYDEYDNRTDMWVTTTECEMLTNRIQITSYLTESKGKLYLIKQIPIDWLKAAQFPIYTDTDITYGTASQFQAGLTYDIQLAVLDSTHFVVCYLDFFQPGQCMIGEVDGNTFTWGSETTFCSDISAGSYNKLDVCAIGTNKIIVGYTDDVLDDDGYTRAATTSGTTIGPWGTAFEVETGDLEHVTCATLDTDKVVFVYNDENNGNTITCRACTTSGTTISCGTSYPHCGGIVDDYPTMSQSDQMGTDKWVSCYRSVDVGPNDGFCFAGTANGTDLTFGSKAEFSANASVDYVDVAKVDTDKFIVVWHNVDSSLGVATAGTLSGTTITYGSDATFLSGNTSNNNVVGNDATHAVIAYSDDSGAEGESNYSSIAWATRAITVGSAETFEAGATGGATDIGLDIGLLTSDKVVICFQEDSGGDDGECIIGDISGAPPPSRRIMIIE